MIERGDVKGDPYTISRSPYARPRSRRRTSRNATNTKTSWKLLYRKRYRTRITPTSWRKRCVPPMSSRIRTPENGHGLPADRPDPLANRLRPHPEQGDRRPLTHEGIRVREHLLHHLLKLWGPDPGKRVDHGRPYPAVRVPQGCLQKTGDDSPPVLRKSAHGGCANVSFFVLEISQKQLHRPAAAGFPEQPDHPELAGLGRGDLLHEFLGTLGISPHVPREGRGHRFP